MTLEANRDFLALILADRDFLAGSENPADIAEDWRVGPCTAEQAEAWMDARAFTACGASDLHLAGFTPKQCDIRVAVYADGSCETLAYAYCNGDVDLDAVRLIVEAA